MKPTTLPRPAATETASAQVILSFDVEEHFRIEAAAGMAIDPAFKTHCCERLDSSTRWLLDQLERAEVQATFFIVGEIARHNPALVRAVHRAGHEIASHGWDHRRVLEMTPATFREDIRQSKDALEQVIGKEVVGYRAPTFSIMRETAWALDVLAEAGCAYDSSIYPVRHDRYGVPGAPRGPFMAKGQEREILELPPATLRLFGVNAPMGGGGYFRLFPLWMTRWALRQTQRCCQPAVAMLYFHPWEFDMEQKRLPLGRMSGFRTYVGIGRTRQRLDSLLGRQDFARAIDVATQLAPKLGSLATFALADGADRNGSARISQGVASGMDVLTPERGTTRQIDQPCCRPMFRQCQRARADMGSAV
jgi:polysaccharide deacetylase family protein (PEP-CTERM system associated)